MSFLRNIQLSVWPGLGNHDYSNNLNACSRAALHPTPPTQIRVSIFPIWEGFFLDEELTWAGYGGVSPGLHFLGVFFLDGDG